MVGVAGKSRGCATCRKRKIKCDEAKPDCGQCQKSRIQCGRYARYPVFIDRGPTGRRKPLPLEEVVPYEPAIVHLYSPETEYTRLVNWFCISFLHSRSSQHDLRPQQHWLALVAAKVDPEPALKAALLAISFARWSSKERNFGLKGYGRNHYQNSLALTQKALSRVENAVSDDILATICAMTIYELFDSTCQDRNAWLKHISGIEKLIYLRGPNYFSQAMPRAILEHIRYILMIKHLNARTSCVLGQPLWLQLPWHGVVKTQEQQVFDQGLILTTLLEQYDCIFTGGRPLLNLRTMFQKCIDILRTLTQLEAEIDSGMVAVESAHFPPPSLSTDESAALLLSITALGIQLEAATLAEHLLHACKFTTTEFALFADIPLLVATPGMGTFREAHMALACRIVHLIEIRRKVQAGGLGILRMTWSLQTAMRQFQSTSVQFEQCSLMLESLYSTPTPFDLLRTPPNLNISSYAPVLHD